MPDTGVTRSLELSNRPDMIAWRNRRGQVVVLQDGRHAYESTTGAFDLVVPLDADQPDNRPNPR